MHFINLWYYVYLFFFILDLSVKTRMRKYLLYLTLFIFIEVILYWIMYDPYQLNFQFGFSVDFVSTTIHFGVDGLSLFFIFLISFLVPCCFLFNWKTSIIDVREYCICLFFMECVLIFVFSVLDILLFYVFFESVLIPMFIFIGLLGLRERRIHASYLLYFYTLFGSLMMLGSLILVYIHIGSTDLQFLQGTEISLQREIFLWIAFFFSFSVKIPMYPFHVWLPEAHVEAPTEGSVLLAGILLKMGSYGFLRILVPMFWNATIFFIPLVFVLCSVAIVYTSFVTLRQIDLKRIVAYSSIAHMNISILGFFAMNIYSIVGSIFLMIGHGIVSAALFFMIGIIYDRYKTRLVKYYSGIVHLMPLFAVFFFFFILGNISFPGTCNFVGEVLIFFGLASSNWLSVLVLCVGIFLCTVYSMLLYNKIVFGYFNAFNFIYLLDMTRLEFFLLVPFVLLMFFLGISPYTLIGDILFPCYGFIFV